MAAPQVANTRGSFELPKAGQWGSAGWRALPTAPLSLAVTREIVLAVQRALPDCGGVTDESLNVTDYVRAIRARPDRAMIRSEWIRRAIDQPEHQAVQADGRIRRWASIPEAGGRKLRVVLMPDGVTVHNAFFDRSFKP